MTPTATYRVQFHAGFTFADAVGLVPYWRGLGISHLYASPIATARVGSTHGYDVVDPTTVNPALGGEEGLIALSQALRAQGMGIVLDIVPNHVAVGGSDNAWWLDVLENGPSSVYARYFDIDWAPADPALTGKVLAPFLGAPYAEALAAGDLRLDIERDLGRISALAHDVHRFPIRREDYADVLLACDVRRVEDLDAAQLEARFGRDAAGRARLHALLDRQHYRLAWWRTAGDAINWRRFFDITELAGLRVEDEAVFEAVHALPLRLYAEGLVDGLRVDHVDGLADPAGYCRRLHAALDAVAPQRPLGASPDRAWLVVEKILGRGELLSNAWDVDGTTGYEFMNEVSALQHASSGAEPLAMLWKEISGRTSRFELEEEAARVEILTGGFAGQVDAAASAFHHLAQTDPATRDLTRASLRRAIVAMVGVFPVYRTYGLGDGAPPSDAVVRDQVTVQAARKAPADAPSIDQLGRWLAGQGPGEVSDRAEAVRRFQQLSAPVSAKAVEDTAFYRYGRLLSRNDVGFDPGRLASTPQAFARVIGERSQTFPRAMLTTATHDHKRGEDVRARLAVLSEWPQAWADQARRWQATTPLDGIDPGDAYMLHQMIVGSWPLDLEPGDGEGFADLAERLTGWQTKALREAKLRTSWTLPDRAYEDACEAYLHRLLTGQAGRAFRQECAAFVASLAAAGVANSFVQTGLRLTLPGVPDLYQGAEYWDFSLVDPDNRRPVDYATRQRSLSAPGELWRHGQTKQRLIADLLAMRAENPSVLVDGALRFLSAQGEKADHVLAFERQSAESTLLVVAALRCAAAVAETGEPRLPQGWWGDTTLETSSGRRRLAELASDQVFSTTWLEATSNEPGA